MLITYAIQKKIIIILYLSKNLLLQYMCTENVTDRELYYNKH